MFETPTSQAHAEAIRRARSERAEVFRAVLTWIAHPLDWLPVRAGRAQPT